MSRQYAVSQAGANPKRHSAIHISITANIAVTTHDNAHGERHDRNAHSLSLKGESLDKARELGVTNMSDLIDRLLARWLRR